MRQKQQLRKFVLASDGPVPYRLTFTASQDGCGVSEAATLTSRLLDRAMHERGGVGAIFPGLRRRASASAAVALEPLDPFEQASLTYYLQHQKEVRRQLERELDDLLDRFDPPAKVGRGEEVWEKTKIECVWFTERTLPTPAQLENFKKEYKRRATKVVRETFDTPNTRTSFTVFMTPQWAQHLLIVRFRDGESLGLTEEG